MLTHPATGEGYLVWQGKSGSELVRFRPSNGDTIATLALGDVPAAAFVAAAVDPVRQWLFLLSDKALLGVDLAANRVAPPSPFAGGVDLAIEPRRGLGVLPHRGGAVTLVDLASWRAYELPLEPPHSRSASAVAVDSEQGRAWVVAGRELAEIDLEARQFVRWQAFEPERDLAGARLAVAAACRRLYIACGELLEVDLDSGQWESLLAPVSCPAPVAHAPNLGLLVSVQNGIPWASYQRCPAATMPDSTSR